MTAIEALFSAVTEILPRIFEVAFAVIAAASAITALTPTPADDRIVARI